MGKLSFIPLGGLGEIGKNMALLDYDGQAIMIDAGLMFPDDRHPGIDYIIPDFVHVLYKGRIVRSGGKELALELEAHGYDSVKEEEDAQ